MQRWFNQKQRIATVTGLVMFFLFSPLSWANEEMESPHDSVLWGRNYYLTKEGFSCETNTPQQTRIYSWVNRIELGQGQLSIWGTLCNDAPEIIATTLSTLDLSENLKFLIYDSETYQFYGYPPVLHEACDNWSWCVAK